MGALRDAVVKAMLLAPLAWMVAFATLCAGATLSLGRLPSYGNPDPKRLDGFAPLLIATDILLVLAVASPLMIAVYVCFNAAFAAPTQLPRRLAGLYLVSGLVMAVWVATDPLALINWVMD